MAEACVNCGQPATHQTTNRGATVAYFCDDDARKVYPDGLQTGQIELIPSDEPGEEIPDRFGDVTPTTPDEAETALKAAAAKKATKTTKKATA